MGKTYIIPELSDEWYIDEGHAVNDLSLTEYIPALRNTQDEQLYVSYNGTEYAVNPEAVEIGGVTGFLMSFNPPELLPLSGAAVVFVPTQEFLRLVVNEPEADAFLPGFKTNFTFSMYVKDGSDDEKKDEDTTGRAPSKNLTVTDFKSSQNMAFRLERVIKHLDPTAKIVDRTLWKLMDILEGLVFSEESSPEQGGGLNDGGGASF